MKPLYDAEVVWCRVVIDPGGEIQGEPQGTLSHPCAQPTIWSQLYTRQLQHYSEGGPGSSQDHKKTIYIRENNPALNRNIGKFNLNHIWDRVLLKTLGLKIGPS